MSSFDTFMKNALLASLGLAAVCGILIFSYTSSKDIEFADIFNGDTLHIDWQGDEFFNDWDDLNVTVRGSFSDYETKERLQKDTVDVVDAIEINSSTENIRFVHEDRDDIEIIFEREVPDTSLYDLNYSVRDIGGTLVIRSELRGNTIHTDRDYLGTITLHVPEDYVCDELIINSAIAAEDIVLPDMVNELDMDVNFGSTGVTINHPMDRLSMDVDAGDMTLVVNAPINTVRTNLDAGEMSIEVNDTIGKLVINNSLGSIKGDFAESPTVMDLTSNMGDVSLDFDEPINTLTAELDLGDLDIDVASDDDGTVYIDSDLVDVKSSLDRTSKKSKANIFVEMNLGSVKIH